MKRPCTPLADSLIDNLVQDWRPRHAQLGEQLGLVVIGRTAQQRIEGLKTRLPDLETVCDVRVVPHNVMERTPEQQCVDLAGVTTIYICRETDAAAAAAVIALWRQASEQGARVIVSFDRRTGLPDLVRQAGVVQMTGVADRLVTFSLAESFLGADLAFDRVTDTLAILIRDEFRDELLRAGHTPATNSYLDVHNLPAQEAALMSSRRQAQHTLHKLDRIGCTIRRGTGIDPSRFQFTEHELKDLAILEHDRWNDERLLDGWEVGPETNRDKKINKYLIAWKHLPKDVKQWDFDVIRKLPMRLARVGFEIVRKPEADSPPNRV